MSAPSLKRSSVGFRSATIYALDVNGYPAAAAGGLAYEGLSAAGAKTLEVNDPAYRVISHTGDDRVMQIDQLPATEGASATLHLGRLDDALEAAVSGLKSFVVGEMNMLGAGVTDISGFEPTIGILAYQQSLDEAGNRRWNTVIFPRATVAKHQSGMSDAPVDLTYSVVPALCSKHLWGTAFATATEGATQLQIVRAVSQYKPKLVAFLGDASQLIFLFPATAQAVATGKIAVWKNGVLITSGITKATTGVTFAVAPAALDNITILYEVA